MPPTVQDILDIIETIAPADLAESWDNVGLMVGNPADEVRSILVGLDPTLPILEEAEALGANLAVTHHPVIFNPLKSVHFEHLDGRFIYTAIRKHINVISCHTNLDATVPGVSDALARLLGLLDTEPLAVREINGMQMGLGRVGNLPAAVPADEFISLLRKSCAAPWLLAAGPKPETITRVAVCGGSCSDLAETALHAGAHVFVTAEVKHNIARWAEHKGLWVIDAGHFATENPGMNILAGLLTDHLQKKNYHIDIMVTQRETSPLLPV